MIYSSGELILTSVLSHVPAQPEPLPTRFTATSKSEFVPSGLTLLPLTANVFPSPESVHVPVLRTLPSFFMTIFQTFVWDSRSSGRLHGPCVLVNRFPQALSRNRSWDGSGKLGLASLRSRGV